MTRGNGAGPCDVWHPPPGRAVAIQTFVPGADFVRRSSVKQVEVPEDVNSDALGVMDWSQRCRTCGNPMERCMGHSAHLELPVPIFSVHYTHQLMHILNSFCVFCQRLRLPPSSPKWKEVADADPKDRPALLAAASRPYRWCGARTPAEGKQPPPIPGSPGHEVSGGGCGLACVEWSGEDKFLCTFLRGVLPLHPHDHMQWSSRPGWRPPVITPGDLLSSLQMLEEPALTMLGCTGPDNHPSSLMWQALPIGSLNIRPAHTYGGVGAGKRRDYHDMTKAMRPLVTQRNQLRALIERGDGDNVNLLRYSVNGLVSVDPQECFLEGYQSREERRVAQTRLNQRRGKRVPGPVEALWRSITVHAAAMQSKRHKRMMENASYCAPASNYEDRYRNSKETGLRGVVIAWRINNCARAVLAGDMYIQPDEIGVPSHVAMTVTVREYVTRANVSKMRRTVLNGPFLWPGSNYVVMSTGETVDLAHHENRADVDMQNVRYVGRHIVNGDSVCVNRQPTLHRPSLMTFRVRVMEGIKCFRMHPCTFGPYGADCDGDEMNIHVPQGVQGTADARELMTLGMQVVKDGKVWVSFVQNAVMGSFLLTGDDSVFFGRDEFFRLCMAADIDGSDRPIPPPAIVRPVALWTGRQLASMLLPPAMCMNGPPASSVPTSSPLCIRRGELLSGTLDSRALNSGDGIIFHVHKYHNPCGKGATTLRLLHMGYRMFQAYLDTVGASVGLEDVSVEEGTETDEMLRVQEYTRRLQAYVDRFPDHSPSHESPDAVALERNIRAHIDRITAASTRAVMNYFEGRFGTHNRMLVMIRSGAKGNAGTMLQMSGQAGQMYVMARRYDAVSSHFLRGQDMLRAHGYIGHGCSSGADICDHNAESHPTGESVVQKNRAATATSGYTSRRIASCIEGIKVDWFGRMIDTRGRVLWQEYGGDGFDPQNLATVSLRVPSISRPVSHEDVAAWPGLLPSWWHKHLAPNESVQQVIEEEAMERSVRSNTLSQTCVKTGVMRPDGCMLRIKSPIHVERIIESVTSSVHQNTDTETSLTPLDAAEFRRALWNNLLRKRLCTPNNVAFHVYLDQSLSNDRLCAARSGKGLARQDLLAVAECVSDIMRRSVVEAGESVGINGSTSTTELATQAALKAPHVAGKFPALSGGVKRLGQLVDNSCPHPSMRVVLRAEHANDRAGALRFGLQLLSTTLSCVCTHPPEVDRDGVITFFMDHSLLMSRAIGVRKVCRGICSFMGWIRLDWFTAPFVMGGTTRVYTVMLRVPPKELIDRKVSAQELALHLHHTAHVSGNTHIENILVEETEVGDGGPKRWQVTTMGSCLSRVLSMPEVDTMYTVSNNMNEMRKVLGLRATQNALTGELLGAVAAADTRHVKVIAKMLAGDLTVRGVQANQAAMNTPIMQRASYERCFSQLVPACASAERDEANTVCAGVLANKVMDIGSGYGTRLFMSESTLQTPSVRSAWAKRPAHVCQYAWFPVPIGGRRAMLCVSEGRLYLVDQTFRVHRLREQILHSMGSEWMDNMDMLSGTVLDGYWCDELVGNGGRTSARYVVTDVLMCCGNRTSTLRADHRNQIAADVVRRMGKRINDTSGSSARECQLSIDTVQLKPLEPLTGGDDKSLALGPRILVHLGSPPYPRNQRPELRMFSPT